MSGISGTLLVLGAFSSVTGAALIYRHRHREEDEEKNSRFKPRQLADDFKEIISAEISKNYRELNLSENMIRKKIKQQESLRRATFDAPLGDDGSREFMLDQAKFILEQRLGISRDTICRAVNFDHPERMSALEKFEWIYTLYKRDHGALAFKQFMRDFGFDSPRLIDGWYRYQITAEDIELAYSSLEKTGDYPEQLDMLAQRVYELSYGHRCADIFIADRGIDGVSGGVGGVTRDNYDYIDEMMTEAYLNGAPLKDMGLRPNSYDMLWVMYEGKLVRLAFASFETVKDLAKVVATLPQYNSKESLSRYNPVVQGTMINNSRTMSLRPETNDGYAFYVRKFTSAIRKPLEELVSGNGRYGNADIITETVRMLTRSERNMLITGNTGGGKTTLLRSLAREINPNLPIRVIEPSFELDLANVFPNNNIQSLQERAGMSIHDLITVTRKLDTEVIILGELNEPKIAGEFVQSCQSGTRQTLGTGHMVTLTDLVDYLRNAVVALNGLPSRLAEEQIVKVLDFDIHQVHDIEGRRYISRISEVVPYDPGEYPKDLVGVIKQYCMRSTDRKTYVENVIAVFDVEKEKYRLINPVTDGMLKKMKGIIGEEEVLAFAGAFNAELERQKAEEPGYYANLEAMRINEEEARNGASLEATDSEIRHIIGLVREIWKAGDGTDAE